jgi:hypothetical protein
MEKGGTEVKGDLEMEEKVIQPPILAEVAVHPTGQLMIILNESIPLDDQARFCLGCAHAFIGYAEGAMSRPKSNIVVPRVVVP